MSQTKQEIRGSKIGGKITQNADTTNTKQQIIDVSAQELEQNVSSKQQTLAWGKHKANGTVAVVALVLLGLAYLIIPLLKR